MACIFTVDVEDWFHILDVPSSPDISRWGSLPSRVEANFRKLLHLFDLHGVRTTCFFLGWIAEKYPHLVREAARSGHEIASHGYSHTLVYNMTPEGFLRDIRRSKEVLENITAEPVIGYRAPGFSATAKVPWFFDKIIEAGYRYDSSVFPARRGHGGMAGSQCTPYLVRDGALIEFPISVVKILGSRLCLFGGGYLRLFPWRLIRSAGGRLMKQDRPLIFYVHPREIDPQHPRLPMNPVRRFKSYVNLSSTEQKVECILKEFPLTTFRQFLEDGRGMASADVSLRATA